jgi:Tfp pilus assembly protein PilZ
MTDDDKRRHERQMLEVTVDWHELGKDDVIWSATGDVGPGGLKIRTLTPPEKGTRVVVVLGPAEQAEALLRVPARVAWVRMDDDFCGMGVAFEPSDATERVALEELLKQLLEEKK